MNEGGDRDKLGRGWVWKGQIPVCIHQNHVFRIRLRDKEFPSEYISHFANENGQRYFFDQGTQTTNLASVSKGKVEGLPFPVPPTDEAVEIVRLIDSTFNWLDRMAADHGAASKLLPKLDTAILAKAFKGELVPQDPNDEPAVLLLQRIAEQRAQGTKTQTRPPKPIGIKAPRIMKRDIEDVLADAGDWLNAQEAFRLCGIADGAETEAIEIIYAKLRELDKAGRLDVMPVADAKGYKQFDRLKLKQG